MREFVFSKFSQLFSVPFTEPSQFCYKFFFKHSVLFPISCSSTILTPKLWVCGGLDSDGNDWGKLEVPMLSIWKGQHLRVHSAAWHTHNPSFLVPVRLLSFLPSNLLARCNSSFPAGKNPILWLSLCETPWMQSQKVSTLQQLSSSTQSKWSLLHLVVGARLQEVKEKFN